MDYTTVSFLCIISLMIGIFSIGENELFSLKQKQTIRLLGFVIIIEIILDSIAMSMVTDNSIFIWIFKVVKITEFILAPVIPVLLSYIITSKQVWVKMRVYYSIIFIINLFINVSTLVYPIIFYIDDKTGIYNRGRYSYLYVIMLFVSFILFIYSAYHTFIQNTTRINITIIAIGLFFLVGLIIRLHEVNSNSDFLAVTLSYFIFIIYFSNNYLKIDSITSLLNRRAYTSMLSQINFSTAIIMIDANSFKSINDNYGHQSGDVALRDFAECILETYSKVGYCYRIGGDEFCVILKPKMLRILTENTEHHNTYKMMNGLMEKLSNIIEVKSKKNEILQYGVSQGYGIYYSSLDEHSIIDYKTIEDVIKQADENMYEKKRKITE